MTLSTPFYFGTNFDKAQPLVKESEVTQTFTEEELMAAKEIAYAEGVAEGRTRQMEVIDADLVKALIGFQDQLVKFVDEEAQNRRQIHYQAAQLAKSVAVKICITESEKHGVERVLKCMDELTQALLEKPNMTIKVHPDLASPLKKRITRMIDEGAIQIAIEESLSILDCQFNWTGGGAESLLHNSMREIDTYINQILE